MKIIIDSNDTNGHLWQLQAIVLNSLYLSIDSGKGY